MKVNIGTQLVVIIRRGSKVWAISPYCPHRGADIWKGDIVDETIRCYLHGYIYDLNTGAPILIPFSDKYSGWRETGNLIRFPVDEYGGEVCITIP
ncbi:hypothetical protein IC007_0464 [Sulfuracidifex tepidarius]|uniref:Rieske domain-containing protein n=2 Tax=Sulfuracidifex tepidarius TaxID=1294262 RepID=A0A510E0F2_9CREN|nr:hypothetical protein IC007_0464 [Sulfuracidifex tepidarius]